jgi:phosphoglycolate phosphatase-like HAD superfamily hydrolase
VDLAIFDVDGTLVRSVSMDASCYVRALGETCGIRGVDSEWVAASDLSDSGITSHLFRERLGRAPRPREVEALRRRFSELLGEASCPEIPGAGQFLRRLADGGWSVALATGGWRECALGKLSRAGIDVAGMPAAFADDGERKLSIVQESLRRAGGPFGKVVFFGDGPGDLAAASALGIGFVAVGERVPGDVPRIPDYADGPAFLARLSRGP